MLRVGTIGTVCYRMLYNGEGCYVNERRVFYCDYDDVSTEHTDADGWCALPERCAVATLTVDFAENGSVIVNLTEEGEKGRTR